MKVKDLIEELKRFSDDAYVTICGQPIGEVKGWPASFKIDISTGGEFLSEEQIKDLKDDLDKAETDANKAESDRDDLDQRLSHIEQIIELADCSEDAVREIKDVLARV